MEGNVKYLKGKEVENYGGNCSYCNKELTKDNQVDIRCSNGIVRKYSVCIKCANKFCDENRVAKKLSSVVVPPAGERIRFVNGKPVKVCSCCKKELPADDFYADVSSKDSLRTWCKTCYTKWQRENTDKKNSNNNLEKRVISLENKIDTILCKMEVLENMWK
jgi:hypothetical protein